MPRRAAAPAKSTKKPADVVSASAVFRQPGPRAKKSTAPPKSDTRSPAKQTLAQSAGVTKSRQKHPVATKVEKPSAGGTKSSSSAAKQKKGVAAAKADDKPRDGDRDAEESHPIVESFNGTRLPAPPSGLRATPRTNPH